MLSFIPGVSSALPSIVAKLHAMKEKYMAAPLPVTSNIKVRLVKFFLLFSGYKNGGRYFRSENGLH